MPDHEADSDSQAVMTAWKHSTGTIQKWIGTLQQDSAPIICPECGGEAYKGIYIGFPFKLCQDEDCSTAWGLGAYLIDIFGWDGWFLTYTGSYWQALWYWLKGDINE